MFEKGALRILKDDHRAFRNLLRSLELSDDRDEQREILEDLAVDLLLHARVEEEMVYPVAKNASRTDRGEPVEQALEAHHVAEETVLDLLETATGTTAFKAKAGALNDLVVAHAAEEEQVLFRRVRRARDDDALLELGERIMERKRALRQEIAHLVVGRLA